MRQQINISKVSTGVIVAFATGLLGIAFHLVLNGASQSTTPVEKTNSIGDRSDLYPAVLNEPGGHEVLFKSTAGAKRESHCIVALEKAASNSLAMSGNATLAAPDCSIFSNSRSASGVWLGEAVTLNAKAVFSSGAIHSVSGNQWATLVSNNTLIDDPLIGRVQPNAGKCDYNNVTLKEGVHTLRPGVYCGGVVSLGALKITLEPGIYTMKDGPLVIGGKAILVGKNVGFVFEGHNSVFGFGFSTTIKLTAPKKGPMAGILFFEDRNARSNRNFIIRSHDARLLEGLIYLPKGRLVIEKASRVGQLSKWTAIIAHQIEIKDRANLRINTDYAGSNVPVPEYLRPSAKVIAFASNQRFDQSAILTQLDHTNSN